MEKDDFHRHLDNYLKGYQCLGRISLWYTELSDIHDDKLDPQVALAKLMTENNNVWTWNEPAVHRFMKLWTPKIVLGEQQATLSHLNIQVDSTQHEVDAYNLFDNNYIRLRDAAALLKGTDKQFAVDWNQATACVEISTGQVYQEENALPALTKQTASALYSTQMITCDGADCPLTAYLIDGTNYVRLRDLAEQLGFTVEWDAATQVITIT